MGHNPHDLALVRVPGRAVAARAIYCRLSDVEGPDRARGGVRRGSVAIGLALILILYARAVRGVWIIDNLGIEFRPKRRPRCRIAWKNVESVRWRHSPLAFLGEGKRIALEQGLDDNDRTHVRERVETMLAGQFDLTDKPNPSQDLNIARVLWLSVPSTLVTALLMLLLPSFQFALAAFTVLGVLAFFFATILWCGIGLYRESERHNPTWRLAKPGPGDRDDWYL